MTVTDSPSPNFGPRKGSGVIDMLVLHYTGMTSAAEALARLRDPAAEVSAHYLIDEDGTIHRLVAEKDRAWHAGRGIWRGESDVNSRSIGIELVNPGHEFGYRAFPQAQIAALIALAQDICRRHPIPARNVIGHSDIAPLRKQDPGELFPWSRLASAGIGLFPQVPAATDDSAERLLAELGYGTDPWDEMGEKVIEAFQRRFRPACIDGVADKECIGLMGALLSLSQPPA